jgi:hypothetical protein
MEKDTGGGKGLELEPGTVVNDASEEHERTLGSRKWMYAYLATEHASGGRAFESTIKVTSGGRYTANRSASYGGSTCTRPYTPGKNKCIATGFGPCTAFP